MNISQSILWKSLVRPFYKQHSGLFAFLIFFMFAAVGRANGVGLLEYHFSLIRGIMTNMPFLLFTLCIWFIYALRCSQFIIDTLGKKEYIFLSLLSLKKPFRVYIMLIAVQMMLLLPVVSYACITLWIGLHHHWYLHMLIILLFFLFISFAAALLNQFVLNNPGKRYPSARVKFLSVPANASYGLFMLRYILHSRKLLLVAIKIFSCVLLYGLLSNLSGKNADLQMAVLFYSFALLGHGVLIYSIRGMEEFQMTFYRGLPVSGIQRFMQYGLLYFILLIPELIIFGWLTPEYISPDRALLLVFFGYSILLFLNSLLFIQFFRKSDYLKIVTGIYLAIFIAVLTQTLTLLSIVLFVLSVYIFSRHYYQFEKS